MDHDYIEQHQVIEEYVRGRLPEAEADRFTDHYLTCKECLRRLELAERFQQGMRDAVAEDIAAPVGLAAIFSSLAWRRLMAGVAALAVVAGFALWWHLDRLHSELNEAQVSLAQAMGRQADDGRHTRDLWKQLAVTRKRLAEETQARSQLASELSRERQPRAGAAWLVALVPVRSGPAAGEPVQRITLPSAADSIVLSLDMDLPGPGPYRIVLRRRDGTAVWEGTGLETGPSGTLAIRLDSSLLAPGDYRLLVEQDGGVPVARFAFRVAR
jgi:hypothetical protein